MITKRFSLFLSVLFCFFLTGTGALFSRELPPAEGEAMGSLNESPRHGEWVSIDAGGGDSLDAWLVYPERSDNAPVVIVVHEIYGLTDWIRGVTDQLAAEGFLAIAPDFLSGKTPGGEGTRAVTRDTARGLIQSLQQEEIVRRLDATARYAAELPSTTDEYGIVGFCWGGTVSFSYATEQPDLGAAVVYYGTSPETETLSRIEAPVLGLYGGDDNRVNSTIPAAEQEMERLGKSYEYEIYDGAGHAFLRARGRDGANLRASEQAWPRMLDFLQEHLGS